MVKLQEELMSCKLRPTENPDKWITQFEGIQRKLVCVFGVTYPDDFLLEMLMKGLPHRYKDLRMSFLRQIYSKVDTLNVKNFKSQIKIHMKYCEYESLFEQTENMELVVHQSSRQNNSILHTCNKFGKYGHSGDNCWRGIVCGKFGKVRHPPERCYQSTPCGVCGQKGHNQENCFYD